MTELTVCAIEDLPPGSVRIVHAGEISVGVYKLDGRLCAIEERCSHDDGPLVEGELDTTRCAVECPRHGSVFDLRSGRPLNLPAYEPVETFDVVVEDGLIRVDVD